MQGSGELLVSRDQFFVATKIIGSQKLVHYEKAHCAYAGSNRGDGHQRRAHARGYSDAGSCS